VAAILTVNGGVCSCEHSEPNKIFACCLDPNEIALFGLEVIRGISHT
jgi:hypothetical protein